MIDVTCAIIEKDGLVLAARRSAAMSQPLKWEFPGGKCEASESPEDCLIREIKEELNIEITLSTRLTPQEYSYPDKSIRLLPYIASYTSGTIALAEHAEVSWFRKDELEALDWAEADVAERETKNYLLA